LEEHPVLRTFEILSVLVSIAAFITGAKIGESIARDVNEQLGSEYQSIWSLDGKTTWRQHKRLYPQSAKRWILIAAILASFVFLILAALFGR
jgi:hypothetical protein